MKAKIYCVLHDRIENVRMIEFINQTIRVTSTTDCTKILNIKYLGELLTH